MLGGYPPIHHMLRDKLNTFITAIPCHEHHTRLIRYTPGVACLISETDATWAINLIAINYRKGKEVWTIKKEGEGAVVYGKTEQGETLGEYSIPYTTFSLECLTLYLINNVLMLATEY